MASPTAPAATDAKAAYARAMTALQAGRFAEALDLFRALHEANPRIAEVEYQIARIFTRFDRFDRALFHAQAAAQLAPSQPAVWTAWADAAALDGSPAARRAFTAALKSSPLPSEAKQPLLARFGAHSGMNRPATGGVPADQLKALLALETSGRHAEAELLAKRLLTAHRGAALVANVLGSALAAQGKLDEALQAYRAAQAADPRYAEALANMAPVLLRLGRADEARQAFRAAIALAPDLLPALAGLGNLALAEGQAKAALLWLDRAATLAPTRADLQLARGNALTLLRDYEAARQAFAAAVKSAGGKDALPLMMLAQAEAHLGQDAEAEAHFAAALALAPGHASILGARGVFLQGLGRFAEAEADFLQAIEADPATGEPYRLYYASHKAKPGEPLIAEMQRRFADPGASDRDRMALGFALAKALEDAKDYGRVFDYLDPANALMRKANPYDIAEREDQVARLMEAMAGMDWQGATIPGATEAAPIFVTGMPRSGTTLVEQIIASHSSVTGAGELADGTVSALRLLFGGKGGGFRPALSIAPAEFAALGQDYAAMIRSRFPDAERITDKSIQTYLTLGLAKLAMPKARFIVVRRDPRDTLLSIYKNVFPAGTHLYGYDQVDLARHYTTFVRMIDFWRSLVPDWFHEIQYEDLVADPEPQSRALIAACGLDWQDACLNFHQNTRKVETLSVFQVRQPISTGSVKAWARYGDRLKPMLDQLRADGHIKD
ncbi:tetratricopeptide repeat-containing sulfotransferase family protein [Xinfangfangia pollutisoli]|uniref:tetratricopeptide repeat-containing sulfotransferase family protein n=1 Tax=Xinfangfangia pollutisoli TaxID=2865960 RepID=UPI001CD75247|nr:tetratricopeptide repeat-containing sulfotransferase family protein [Xinfangfangia pollutisoli]